MKRSAQKSTEKDGAKAPVPARSPRKRSCTKKGEEEGRHCINGHTACAQCCVYLNRKCGWCDAAIDVRCRAAENMLAEMNTNCEFSIYGCAETVKFVQKRAHEEACHHAPYRCPVDGCSYRGMNADLYAHVFDEHDGDVYRATSLKPFKVTLHKDTPFQLIALEDDTSKLFLLLNGGVQAAPAGRSLHLVCLGRRPEGNVGISYKMKVRGTDSDTLSLRWSAPCIRGLEGFEAKKFLFVPDAYWGTFDDSVTVSVRIG